MITLGPGARFTRAVLIACIPGALLVAALIWSLLT